MTYRRTALFTLVDVAQKIVAGKIGPIEGSRKIVRPRLVADGEEEIAERKSAVIIPVPDAEPIVGEARRLYDPAARAGVPAHITLLYPFCPAPVLEETIQGLVRLFAGAEPIALSFADVGRFANTLYLEPSPKKPLIGMIEALLLRWPDCLPYRGEHESVVPHLTVANHQDDQRLLSCLAEMVVPHLPLRTTVTEAWLIETRDDGLWHRRAAFSFSSRNAVGGVSMIRPEAAAGYVIPLDQADSS